MITAFALAPFTPTSAQETYRPPIAHERRVTTVVIHADGTHELLMEDLVRIETELGVTDHGEKIISFNAALLTLVSAHWVSRLGCKPLLVETTPFSDRGKKG